MTLHALVAATGGDLYCGGLRANIPAPGHSLSDRSVSLLVSGDRLVIHTFGSTLWTDVRDHLRASGHIDINGRLMTGARPGSGGRSDTRPDHSARLAAAARLWEGAGPITNASLSARHLETRAIRTDPVRIEDLRHHPGAPVSVYRPFGPARRALIAAIRCPAGELTAVEVTYLAPGGRRDDRLRLARKMVGLVPPGSAVRLAPSAKEMLVGEGVMSVLSAAEWFGLPAWALLSARNLSAWTPPAGTGRVMVAADRGAPGEAAARRLVNRLTGLGLEAAQALPPTGAEDWNAFAVRERRKEGG